MEACAWGRGLRRGIYAQFTTETISVVKNICHACPHRRGPPGKRAVAYDGPRDRCCLHPLRRRMSVMSLHPHGIEPVPEATARVAHAAFPKGHPSLTVRDVLGTILQDD